MDEKEREKIKSELQKKRKKIEMEYKKNKRQFEKTLDDATEEYKSYEKTKIAESISKKHREEKEKERQLKFRKFNKIFLIVSIVSILGSNTITGINSYKKGNKDGYEKGLNTPNEVVDVVLDDLPNNYTLNTAPDELLISWANYVRGIYEKNESDNDKVEDIINKFAESMSYYTKYEGEKDQFYNKASSDEDYSNFRKGIYELDNLIDDEYKFKRLYGKARINEDGVI